MRSRKIEKWDEIYGTEPDEEYDLAEPEELAGAGPSISKNPMKGIEDMLEQNDNSLDGVLNNIEPVLPVVMTIPVKEDKESVRKRMQMMLELMVRRRRMANSREIERGMV